MWRLTPPPLKDGHISKDPFLVIAIDALVILKRSGKGLQVMMTVSTCSHDYLARYPPPPGWEGRDSCSTNYNR